MISKVLSKVSSESPNAKIFRAGLIVSGSGVVIAVATILKELTVARYFGRNDTIDAFFVALLLPLFVTSLVVGSLGTALIPVFVEARQQRGLASAQKLFSSVMFLDIAALSVVALLLGLLAPYYLPYLGAGFSPEKLRMTREMLLVLLPYVVFNGTALCISAVLNAGERFALPAIVPLITPVVVILFIVMAAKQWGGFAIVAGTVSGSIVEASALTRALRRQGLQFRVAWTGLSADVRSVLGQVAPMVAGTFLIAGTLVVDKSMAAMLPSGSVAALNYANKVSSGIFAVGATALSTAAFPYFSLMVGAKDWSGCRHTLKRYCALVLSISVPITLFLIAFSKPIVRFFFQRGAFTPADTEVVSKVQACYLLQIPFYLCVILFVRFLTAARRNDMLMYGAGISLVLDVALNLMFMRYWGVAGIALSTSAVYLCSFLYVIACSLKVLKTHNVAYGHGSLAANASYPE